MNFSIILILFMLDVSNVYANDSQTMGLTNINIPAVIMFIIFVSITLGITYWAAKKNTFCK